VFPHLSDDERDAASELAPQRSPDLGGGGMARQSRQELVLPGAAVPLVGQELDRADVVVAEEHADRGVEELLPVEQAAAGVIPDDVAAETAGEPQELLPQPLGPDHDHLMPADRLLERHGLTRDRLHRAGDHMPVDSQEPGQRHGQNLAARPACLPQILTPVGAGRLKTILELSKP